MQSYKRMILFGGTRMDIVDNYLQPRISLSPNVEFQHVQEVGGYCPLCGKLLMVKKRGKVNKNYQIAHIYPNSPTEHQRIELEGLERLGNSCEDYENKIALCRDCHALFDANTTKEEYLKIFNIKKQLLVAGSTQVGIASKDIEEDLLLIIESISSATDENISEQALKYKGIKIANKVEVEYYLLRRKIEFNVYTYYGFIRESMRNLADEKKLNFEVVASEVRTAYLKAKTSADDKVVIFNALVQWLHSKMLQASRESCEAIISFFVQNCEVFDEISE